jgi:hypothetical protein
MIAGAFMSKAVGGGSAEGQGKILIHLVLINFYPFLNSNSLFFFF